MYAHGMCVSRVNTSCSTRSVTRAAAAAICAAAIVAATTAAPCTAEGWGCNGFLHRTRNALGRRGDHAGPQRCCWWWKHRRTVRRRGTPFDPLNGRKFAGGHCAFRAARARHPPLRTTFTRRTPSISRSHRSLSPWTGRERRGQRESPPLLPTLRSPAHNTALRADRGADASERPATRRNVSGGTTPLSIPRGGWWGQPVARVYWGFVVCIEWRRRRTRVVGVEWVASVFFRWRDGPAGEERDAAPRAAAGGSADAAPASML